MSFFYFLHYDTSDPSILKLFHLCGYTFYERMSGLDVLSDIKAAPSEPFYNFIILATPYSYFAPHTLLLSPAALKVITSVPASSFMAQNTPL